MMYICKSTKYKVMYTRHVIILGHLQCDVVGVDRHCSLI